MAKLSAHGQEIGRVSYTTYTKAYMSDGKVLQNDGFGWKLRGKLKAGLTPETAFQNATARMKEWERDNPNAFAYKKALHSIAGQSKRWKLHACIQLMPDDCDGVWSEACDGYGDNISASIDEIAELCRLYRVALAERQESVTV